jgi:diguanylate cyclase (GGDEF)-like protein
VIAVGLALVALVAILDYLTGYEVSFSVFYLLPIVLVTWFAQPRAGFFFCVISAMVWLFVDYASGHHYHNHLVPFWNACVRLGFFSVTTYVLIALKTNLTRQEAWAMTDGLTGLLNARMFKEISSRMLRFAARRACPAVLGYLDVDNFKAVNDAFGHAEGDLVLVTLANTLTRCVRPTDVVGRLGGDEFAILLTETDYQGAQIVFGRIREKVTQDAIDGGWAIGLSIGAAVFSSAPTTIDEALKIADGLMYRVKKTGKNSIIYEEIEALQRGREIDRTCQGQGWSRRVPSP